MKKRHFLVPMLTLLGLAAVTETAARRLQLDNLQALSVSWIDGTGPVTRAGSSGESLGVDYLPRGFEIDDQGFTTLWGRCDFAHPGPTVLALGDSTTRASTPNARDTHSALATWPRMLKTTAEVQVCVIAEDGYHPADLAAIELALRPSMTWDLIILLLCHNDARPTNHRNTIRGEPGALHHPPPYRLAYAPLWQPWLFKVSEAFRYLHWRLALEVDDRIRIPDPDPIMKVGASLASLATSPLRIFYLPPVGPHPDGPGALREITRATADEGLPLQVIDLPERLASWRKSPADLVHMNRVGHTDVAMQMDTVLAADPEVGVLFSP